MNDPLISIVLPTYNGENSGLDASIESCLNQTYRNFELIIVNDGSTDRTEEIVREWLDKDERIKLINHGVNKNLPTALNTGFAAAKGDYLTWTSDDNQYKPKALQRMLETLQENPDVDMVYCDYEKVVTMEQDFIGHGTRGIVDDPGELINFGGVVCGCFLYKKEVRELVGDYNTDYFMAEDYEYWLRVAANCKMQPLHEILYYYTYSDSCMSAARAHKVWELFNPMLRMQYAKTWKYYSRPKRSAKYLENAMI